MLPARLPILAAENAHHRSINLARFNEPVVPPFLAGEEYYLTPPGAIRADGPRVAGFSVTACSFPKPAKAAVDFYGSSYGFLVAGP